MKEGADGARQQLSRELIAGPTALLVAAIEPTSSLLYGVSEDWRVCRVDWLLVYGQSTQLPDIARSLRWGSGGCVIPRPLDRLWVSVAFWSDCGKFHDILTVFF